MNARLIFRQKVSRNVYHFDVVADSTECESKGEITIGFIIVNVLTKMHTYKLTEDIAEETRWECLNKAMWFAESISNLEP